MRNFPGKGSLAQAMPVNQARELLRISHTPLTGFVRYYVMKAVTEMDLSGVRSICVDEKEKNPEKQGLTMHAVKLIMSKLLAESMDSQRIGVCGGRDIGCLRSTSRRMSLWMLL